MLRCSTIGEGKSKKFATLLYILVPPQLFIVCFVPYKLLMINRLSFAKVFNYWLRKMHEMCNPSLKYTIIYVIFSARPCFIFYSSKLFFFFNFSGINKLHLTVFLFISVLKLLLFFMLTQTTNNRTCGWSRISVPV